MLTVSLSPSPVMLHDVIYVQKSASSCKHRARSWFQRENQCTVPTCLQILRSAPEDSCGF